MGVYPATQRGVGGMLRWHPPYTIMAVKEASGQRLYRRDSGSRAAQGHAASAADRRALARQSMAWASVSTPRGGTGRHSGPTGHTRDMAHSRASLSAVAGVARWQNS